MQTKDIIIMQWYEISVDLESATVCNLSAFVNRLKRFVSVKQSYCKIFTFNLKMRSRIFVILNSNLFISREIKIF